MTKRVDSAIVQDAENGRGLMLAYMNEASFRMTLESGYTHFWSPFTSGVLEKRCHIGRCAGVEKTFIMTAMRTLC